MSEERALEVIPAEGRELATMDNPPAAVLMEAQKAAAALKDVIARKPKPVMMGGEQYLEFEDWQTLARFYGLTAGEEHEPEFVSLDGVKGFKATAVALFQGRVVSRATAYCLNDEEKWSTRTKYEYHYTLRSGGTSAEDPGKDEIVWEDNPFKEGKMRPAKVKVTAGEESVPLYQLASMAQTRANAKVLRNVLSWVAVLAGYKPTPAEEMESVGAKPVEREPEKRMKARGSGKAKDVPDDIRKQGREPGADDGAACPHCGSKEIQETEDGHAFCGKCRKGI